MARPMVVIQQRDPNAYISRAFDTAMRGALQGWQMYNESQRQEAAQGIQALKLMQDAAKQGPEAYMALIQNPQFRRWAPDNIVEDVERFGDQEMVRREAASNAANVNTGQSGVTLGGEQVLTAEQAQGAISPDHMLSGVSPVPHADYPTTAPSAVPPPADWRAPSAVGDEAPRQPVEAANRTAEIGQIIANRPEGFSKKQFSNMNRYINTHPSLEALKAEADQIRTETGAKYDPNKGKGLKRWTGKGLTRDQKITLEQDRRIDTYIAKYAKLKAGQQDRPTQGDVLRDQEAFKGEQEPLSPEMARKGSAEQIQRLFEAPEGDPSAPPTLPELVTPSTSLTAEEQALLRDRPDDYMLKSAVSQSVSRRSKQDADAAREQNRQNMERFDRELALWKEQRDQAGKGVTEFKKLDPFIEGNKPFGALSDNEKEQYYADASAAGFQTKNGAESYYEKQRLHAKAKSKRSRRLARIQPPAEAAKHLIGTAKYFRETGQPEAALGIDRQIKSLVGAAVTEGDLTPQQAQDQSQAVAKWKRAKTAATMAQQRKNQADKEVQRLQDPMGKAMMVPNRARLLTAAQAQAEAAQGDVTKNLKTMEEAEEAMSPESIEEVSLGQGLTAVPAATGTFRPPTAEDAGTGRANYLREAKAGGWLEAAKKALNELGEQR